MMAQQNWDAAESLAREADRLGVVYGKGEDTPRAIFEEVGKARSDPKQLLVAARAALQRGELDRAEQLANSAERWTRPGTCGATVRRL
jgi:hypothetical protein